MLTFEELESITNDYFAAAGGKAVDIYFRDSFLLDLLMNKKRGLFERPAGGLKIRIPLNYSGAEGGFFTRSDPLSSDDRESINAAYFLWKHGYGNATVYMTDELESNGDYAAIQFVDQKLENAQKTVTAWLAKTIYADGTDTAPTLTGLGSLVSTDTSRPYGGIAEADLVADDGSTPWHAVFNSDAEAISLEGLQTMRSSAKLGDGATGKPNIAVTTETLYNKVSRILQVQQRFVKDEDTAKAGFTHLVYEGMTLAADDYCPTGHCYAINTNYLGFAIHQDGFFKRIPWADLQGPVGRTMKILWHGNLICSNRKAHAGHSNLS